MNTSKNILIVDDEIKILEVVKAFLLSKGFSVFTAVNGREAFNILDTQNISLILLDLMLPDMTGEEICKIIREKSRVPIIMLTAKVQEADMLEGFQIGADDYIIKPFSLANLGARIDAVMRRSKDDLKPLFNKKSWNDGDLEIDFNSCVVKKNNVQVNLTASEYKILSILIKYPTKVFNREEIIEEAFGEDFDGYDRTIDFHVKNIRGKIEDDPKNPVYLLTLYGLGYKFGGEKND